MSTKRFILLILIPIVLLNIAESRDANTLKEGLRNNTISRARYQNGSNSDNGQEMDNENYVLKVKAQEMLKQCGVERETNNHNGYNNNNPRNRYSNNGRNSRRNSYGNENFYFGNRNEDRLRNFNSGQNGEWNVNGNPADDNNNEYKNNRRQTERSQNNGRYGNNGQGYDSTYSSQNNNPYWSRSNNNRRYQSSSSNAYDLRGDSNDDCCTTNGRDNNNMMYYRNGYNVQPPYYGFQNRRQRRSSYFHREDNESNENNQCVSQCVFDYLHLLDDDRSPSETMFIKWLQDNVAGSDIDRIKALRDTRKCFAMLTTTDIEDGCEFSTELSKCMELDLE
ncbi:hypothetical protein ABEB36_012001 [Hypothenemus hampei]|uniref:Uncharacterized protein n=1 Tax=Hypothenemus hampei TaxID=57062 RepID=A0ABD1E9U8_HYPHA